MKIKTKKGVVDGSAQKAADAAAKREAEAKAAADKKAAEQAASGDGEFTIEGAIADLRKEIPLRDGARSQTLLNLVDLIEAIYQDAQA